MLISHKLNVMTLLLLEHVGMCGREEGEASALLQTF